MLYNRRLSQFGIEFKGEGLDWLVMVKPAYEAPYTARCRPNEDGVVIT